MRRIVGCSLLAFILLPAWALSALPPLIDRDLFFSEPEISGVQISPDGRYLSFVRFTNGTSSLWVKKTYEPLAKARPVTEGGKRAPHSHFWSRDGKYILFEQDVQGDENFALFAVDPGAPGSARNLTDVKGVRVRVYSMPAESPGTVYVGMNDRDRAWHDLYAIDIATGSRLLVRANDLRATWWTFDSRGQPQLATRSTESGDREILRLDDDGSAANIYSCTVFETCSPLQFHEDGKRFYMRSDRGSDVNLARLVLVDVQNGKESVVEADPEQRVDLHRAVFSPRTGELTATVYIDDLGSRWIWRDAAEKENFALLQAKLPRRELSFTTTSDGKLWLVFAQADVEPGETYLFDTQTKQLSLVVRALEQIPRSALAETKVITYSSSDGLRIPAYLTLPNGVDPKRLPVIVMAHGGPWARDSWGYTAFTQFFANRGFAVLQPNYRGSTGYGKRFLNAGNHEWGEKIQDDITSGVRYLIAQGIADPKRVGIFGGSYGGYVALAGAAFTPDLYSAAVSLVGPSNLPAVVESLTAFAPPARRMFHERVGDPTTPEGRARLERQSPLKSAARIKTPLLIVHGANDPRVLQADSDALVAAVRNRGLPVEYLVLPDEGHVLGVGRGFARQVNNQAVSAATEAFLAQRLGTRYQSELKPEVAQRLKEIRVH
jgi:dipeptidyl aminopeptidase/acylaminoacyl peptidase